ncbi:MAG: DUF5668 domain-containing protein [Dehalococcoidales bacterium]|nr:DUF5668 domain-containing protein [Dehalococcoidales bacterium]
MFFGLALLVIGIVALLVKLGALPGSIWDYIWPALLIILGISILSGRRRGWHGCCWGGSSKDEEKK